MTQRKQHLLLKSIPWNIARVCGGDPLADGGKSIRVGVVDTGINFYHPDLQRNVKGGINIVDPSSLPLDDNGHGTHVSGIIGASADSFGIVGVAPAVSLYAIKVMDAEGRGKLDDLLHGIAWAIRNDIHILNISITDDSFMSPDLIDAVQKAIERGIFIVAAAGNNGYPEGFDDTVLSPARIPEVIAVAALDHANEKCPFSAAGPSIDIAAPGASIYSTYLGSEYTVLSGTSMAAAHVSGVAAILRQRHPQASPQQIKNMLLQTMRPLPAQAQKQLHGAGLVRLTS